MNLLTSQILAQNIYNPVLGPLGNLSGAEFFGRLISALISFGFVIGGIVFVFVFILGAIQWITSGGDKMRMEQARSKIFNALVGIIILFSFFAILNVVECFFGIGLRRLEVGPFNISLTGGLNCSGGAAPTPPGICEESPPPIVCPGPPVPCCDTEGNWSCQPGPCPL